MRYSRECASVVRCAWSRDAARARARDGSPRIRTTGVEKGSVSRWSQRPTALLGELLLTQTVVTVDSAQPLPYTVFGVCLAEQCAFVAQARSIEEDARGAH